MSKYEWDDQTRDMYEKTKYKRAFIDYMDDNNIKYSDIDDFCVSVTYSGDNMKSIKVYVFFDKDGDDMVQLCCMEIAGFKGNEAEGIIVCNNTNAKYRWVKFYIDDDGDLMCEIDAYLDEHSSGSECMRLVRRVVSIVDEVYPTFMRALWSK
jgi:hypothetical protein